MRLTFTISLKPSFSVGWGRQKSRLKLTSAKVDSDVEVELGKKRCSYWISFALSFSDPEIYFFCWVGGVGGESEDKAKLRLSYSES